MKVYIANFGLGNSLWPRCLEQSRLATYENVATHPYWTARDRAGFIKAALTKTITARRLPPTKGTASRWYNLMVELSDTGDDLWISRQGGHLWWTYSMAGELTESLQPSPHPTRDGPQVWLLEKPCQPWSNKDRQGRPLLWDAQHPKARDFLATESTFQTLSDANAAYAIALIEGQPLDAWHRTPVYASKLATANKRGGRVFSPKEIAAARMVGTMLKTVADANGQQVLRHLKIKDTTLSQTECEALLLEMMDDQDGRCALTGLPLQYDGEHDDQEMLVSLDRIDSKGHYTPDNLQLVCRFANRWKSADNNELFKRLVGVVRSSAHPVAEL